MKKTINLAGLALVIGFAVPIGVAQERTTPASGAKEPSQLPAFLRPSDYAVQCAKDIGAKVFKLLPLENGGQRGSSFGSYYFFKNSSYGPSQIGFLRGELMVGDAWNHGFFTDLGERDLSDVDRTSPEVAHFISYKPPRLDPDIRVQVERFKGTTVDGLKLTRSVAARVGHTYLLRSISYDDWSDVAVVLHVIESSTDGSITLLWKEMAEFPVPVRLFMTDEEMQKEANTLLNELKMPNLQVKIEDNRLVPIGIDVDVEFGRFRDALHKRNIRYRGIDFSKMKRSVSKPNS